MPALAQRASVLWVLLTDLADGREQNELFYLGDDEDELDYMIYQHWLDLAEPGDQGPFELCLSKDITDSESITGLKLRLQAKLSVPNRRFGTKPYFNPDFPPQSWTVLQVNGFDYPRFCQQMRPVRARLLPVCWWEFPTGRAEFFEKGQLLTGPPHSDELSEFGVSEDVSCIQVLLLKDPPSLPYLLTRWRQDHMPDNWASEGRKLGLEPYEVIQAPADGFWRWSLDSKYCLFKPHACPENFAESVNCCVRGGYLRYQESHHSDGTTFFGEPFRTDNIICIVLQAGPDQKCRRRADLPDLPLVSTVPSTARPNERVLMLAGDALRQHSTLSKEWTIQAWLDPELNVTDSVPDASFDRRCFLLLSTRPEYDNSWRTDFRRIPPGYSQDDLIQDLAKRAGSFIVIASEFPLSLSGFPFDQIFTADWTSVTPEILPISTMRGEFPRLVKPAFAFILKKQRQGRPFLRFPVLAGDQEVKRLLQSLNLDEGSVAVSPLAWHDSLSFCLVKSYIPECHTFSMLAFTRNGALFRGCRRFQQISFDLAVLSRTAEGLELSDTPAEVLLADQPPKTPLEKACQVLAVSDTECTVLERFNGLLCFEMDNRCHVLLACWTSSYGELRYFAPN